MPRAPVTPLTLLGSYPVLPLTAGSATFAPTAADAVNLNLAAFGSASKLLVIAYNSDVGAQTVTITSVADQFQRVGDITAYSIAAGQFGIFGPFLQQGWKQSDGNLYFAASSANVKFFVIQM